MITNKIEIVTTTKIGQIPKARQDLILAKIQEIVSGKKGELFPLKISPGGLAEWAIANYFPPAQKASLRVSRRGKLLCRGESPNWQPATVGMPFSLGQLDLWGRGAPIELTVGGKSYQVQTGEVWAWSTYEPWSSQSHAHAWLILQVREG